MELVNCTPHMIDIRPKSGPTLKIPASGFVARVDSEPVEVDSLRVKGGEIPIYAADGYRVIGLPGPRLGSYYVVSNVVLSALMGTRDDVLAPADLIRSANGKPIGCRGLRK